VVNSKWRVGMWGYRFPVSWYSYGFLVAEAGGIK